jgi:hypothetical protein
MGRWDALEARLNTALDEAFAECFLFRPMGEGDIAGPQPDPERDERQIGGVFAFESELAVARDVHGIGKNAKFSGRVQTGVATLSIEQGQFAEPPRQGDHFYRLDKPGKPLFRAVTVHEDGLRLIVTLQELS